MTGRELLNYLLNTKGVDLDQNVYVRDRYWNVPLENCKLDIDNGLILSITYNAGTYNAGKSITKLKRVENAI